MKATTAAETERGQSWSVSREHFWQYGFAGGSGRRVQKREGCWWRWVERADRMEWTGMYHFVLYVSSNCLLLFVKVSHDEPASALMMLGRGPAPGAGTDTKSRSVSRRGNGGTPRVFVMSASALATVVWIPNWPPILSFGSLTGGQLSILKESLVF